MVASVFKGLQRQLQTLVKVNGKHPKYIRIHCGGNDIGFTKVHKIREYVVDAIKFVNEHISGAKIIAEECVAILNK